MASSLAAGLDSFAGAEDFGFGRRGLVSAIAGVHAAKQRTDFNGLTFFGDDFGEHAVFRRGDFNGNLVGFQFDEHVIALDGVTRCFEPLADGGFGNALAECRD